jgi:dihydroorotase
MVGLETAASVAQSTLIDTGLIDWVRFEQLLSTNPAQISGLARHGKSIVAGNPANITFVNPSVHFKVSDVSESKSANNPYLGMELSGQIVHTVFEGALTVKDSKIQEKINV